MFLNKIIEDGSVPQALNVGKCMLIHKVTTAIVSTININISYSRVVILWILVTTAPSPSPPTSSGWSPSGCASLCRMLLNHMGSWAKNNSASVGAGAL